MDDAPSGNHQLELPLTPSILKDQVDDQVVVYALPEDDE